MELTQSLVNIVRKWASQTESKMKDILAGNGKASSRLYANLRINVKSSENEITVETTLPDYAIFVDQGRKPGKQPPMQTIEAWCKSKGIDRKWAFPIARNIGKYGLPPTNFLKPLKDLDTLIKSMTDETITVLTDEIINKIK